MISEKPNYYAIIPATVRYDKDLSPNAKLLYGEITALANARGYCWATNKYFKDIYGISSDRTIQNLLKQLNDKKYIEIVLDNNNNRKIFITDTPAKKCGVGAQKFSEDPAKNCGHNNINNNTPGITTIEIDEDYNWLEDC